MSRALRRVIFAVFALAGVAGVGYGLASDHWAQAVSNATMICLSCIGIQ